MEQKEKTAKRGCRVVRKETDAEKNSRKTQGLFIRRLVRFKCEAPVDSKVFVAGTFNDWNPSDKELKYSMKEQAFVLRMYLVPGQYEYKFVVNGNWILDEQNPERRENGLQSYNSVLNIQ